ncbi:MAG: electron transfer flavoprotein subunit alpha/FixB family protein [Candidatus Thermoplasmatota archaeon]|jgi:electron transfer flavoprotein alpha subunit|nr:electron transfer flavoprotein subunit alpha/FixB family protein [Candidatus Thermoplasmatota archaeon]
MKFLVFSDNLDNGKQIMSYLNGKGEFVVYTPDDSKEYADYGASRVVYLKGEHQAKPISELIASEIKSNGFDFVFITSTVTGRDLAAFLSQAINADIIPEVFDVKLQDSKVSTKRYGLGGKVVLEEESNGKIFTVIPGISDAVPSGTSSQVETKEIQRGNVNILSVNPKKGREVDLEKASIIVSVGRGLGKKEGIAQIEPFVKLVKGELAGSRPVCLDYRWLSEDRQVGYSGRKVKPKIYIALGISGQIQHIAGMRDSKIVIAVNKDKAAPIFQEADYGIVGDLYQVVPKIMGYLS